MGSAWGNSDLLFDKRRGFISKVGVGGYALQTVPEKYHQIIQEALRIRNGHKKSCYKSISREEETPWNT
ncbi:hypothetical protein ABE41_006705 [Fictibacillus arsenicus]|uniref:Uncharacterized protein n=1 Tax=Fictibacillus arsenicus TaxID=255247 RepID=A0A1B1Z2I8_9BACL|nr:hypothetical protein ABE41_006705 [Fictibacillus arsenicus]